MIINCLQQTNRKIKMTVIKFKDFIWDANMRLLFSWDANIQLSVIAFVWVLVHHVHGETVSFSMHLQLKILIPVS